MEMMKLNMVQTAIYVLDNGFFVAHYPSLLNRR